MEKWLSQRSGEEVSWAGKGAFLFHTELCADIVTHVLMLCHYAHLWVLHGLAIHFIDAVLLMDVRFLATALYGRVRSAYTPDHLHLSAYHPASVSGSGWISHQSQFVVRA